MPPLRETRVSLLPPDSVFVSVAVACAASVGVVDGVVTCREVAIGDPGEEVEEEAPTWV